MYFQRCDLKRGCCWSSCLLSNQIKLQNKICVSLVVIVSTVKGDETFMGQCINCTYCQGIYNLLLGALLMHLRLEHSPLNRIGMFLVTSVGFESKAGCYQ